jgi:hypothetical protein
VSTFRTITVTLTQGDLEFIEEMIEFLSELVYDGSNDDEDD